MNNFNLNEHPHRRYNPLIDEWVLVSPNRDKRPWQGQKETSPLIDSPVYDENCFLCPGNIRMNGSYNPDYKNCYVFDNDYAALMDEELFYNESITSDLFKINPERGITRVVCFSPRHNLTLPDMSIENIIDIITAWKNQYSDLGKKDFINYVQIFENKGAIMGCSNPHPHCQIWAQSSLPTQVAKTQQSIEKYYKKKHRSLLLDYMIQETDLKERIILNNDHFVTLVPFWATWPFETLVISRRHFGRITDMTTEETIAFAEMIKKLTTRYDNLFETSFPYSSGIHQAPTDSHDHPEWHFHMHFYPPLLRSATVKKFMVGYEMLGEAQRDITPEKSASLLRGLSDTHYKSTI